MFKVGDVAMVVKDDPLVSKNAETGRKEKDRKHNVKIGSIVEVISIETYNVNYPLLARLENGDQEAFRECELEIIADIRSVNF